MKRPLNLFWVAVNGLSERLAAQADAFSIRSWVAERLMSTSSYDDLTPDWTYYQLVSYEFYVWEAIGVRKVPLSVHDEALQARRIEFGATKTVNADRSVPFLVYYEWHERDYSWWASRSWDFQNLRVNSRNSKHRNVPAKYFLSKQAAMNRMSLFHLFPMYSRRNLSLVNLISLNSRLTINTFFTRNQSSICEKSIY